MGSNKFSNRIISLVGNPIKNPPAISESKPLHLKYVSSLIVLLLFFTSLNAQFPLTYPNCPPVQSSDFRTNYLFAHPGRSEQTVKNSGAHSLLRFDLLKNGDDYDVYYGGFEGILYRFNSQNNQITQIHNFKTIQGSVNKPYGGGDHGLTGIAFHPNFENNRWVFVFYTPMVPDSTYNRVMKLSRFELNTNFKLEKEKEILIIEGTTSDKWHSGGDMYFTAHGDLFLQVGDNVEFDRSVDNKVANAAWASANTTNLLGGTVRIHPDSSAAGYSIPKGNFGEHFAPLENDPGYLDTSRVKPEIFTKGSRSNFTATGHPTELIHIWGEVGSGGFHDEINVIDAPVYGGWPHFQGNDTASRTGGSIYRYPFDMNDIPTLSQDVAGSLVSPKAIQSLPKVYLSDMVPGNANRFNVVLVQAMYYYGKGDSIWPGRTFPPHFHESFMFSSMGGANARIVPLIRTSNTVTGEMKDGSYGVASLLGGGNARIFQAMTGAKYGPDGALYILSRGGGYNSPPGLLTRIDYTGTCHDQNFFNKNRQTFTQTSLTSSDAERYRTGFFDPGLYRGNSFVQKPEHFIPGKKLKVKVYNIEGKLVATFNTQINKNGNVEKWDGSPIVGSQTTNGIYVLKYSDVKGTVLFSKKQFFN